MTTKVNSTNVQLSSQVSCLDKPSTSATLSPPIPTKELQRPSLTPPYASTVAHERRFLELLAKLGDGRRDLLNLQVDQVEGLKQESQGITSRESIALKEAAANAQTSSYWSFLARAASAIFSVYCGVQHNDLLTGGALIALGLGNFAAQEAGLYESLPISLPISGAIAALTHLYGAPAGNSLVTAIQTASSVQNGWADFQGGRLKATLQALTTEKETNEHRVDQVFSSMGTALDRDRSLLRTAKRFTRTTTEIGRIVTQDLRV